MSGCKKCKRIADCSIADGLGLAVKYACEGGAWPGIGLTPSENEGQWTK